MSDVVTNAEINSISFYKQGSSFIIIYHFALHLETQLFWQTCVKHQEQESSNYMGLLETSSVKFSDNLINMSIKISVTGNAEYYQYFNQIILTDESFLFIQTSQSSSFFTYKLTRQQNAIFGKNLYRI